MTDYPVTLALDVPSFATVGTPVPFVLHVRNETGHPIAIHLSGHVPTFDVVVRRLDEEVVWRRLEGEVLQMVLQLRVLEPGDALELPAEWDQRTSTGEPAASGLYRVQALLLTDEPEPLHTAPRPLSLREK